MSRMVICRKWPSRTLSRVRITAKGIYQIKRITLKKRPNPSHCASGAVLNSRELPLPGLATVVVAVPTVTVLTEGMDAVVPIVVDVGIVGIVGIVRIAGIVGVVGIVGIDIGELVGTVELMIW